MNKKPNPTIPQYIQLAIELNNLSPQITAAQSAFATWSTQCDSNGVETFQSWLSIFLASDTNFNEDGPNNPSLGDAYSTFVAPILDSLILWGTMNYLIQTQGSMAAPCSFLEWWNSATGISFCTQTGSGAGVEYYNNITQTFNINLSCSTDTSGSVTCTYQPFGSDGSTAAAQIICFLQSQPSVFTYQNSTLSQWNETLYSQACLNFPCSKSPSKHPLNTSIAAPQCPPTTPPYEVFFMYSQGIAQLGYISSGYLTSLNPISFNSTNILTLNDSIYPMSGVYGLCFSSLTYDSTNSALITSVSYVVSGVPSSNFLNFSTSSAQPQPPFQTINLFPNQTNEPVTIPIANSISGCIIASNQTATGDLFYVALVPAFVSNTNSSNWSLYFINNNPQIYATFSVGQNITTYPQYSTPAISMSSDNTLVSVCCCNTNQVLIYNVNNTELAATITTINGPTQAAFTSNNTVYVTGSDGVFTIDTNDPNYTVTPISGSPVNCQNIVITPNGNYAYFNTTSGSLYVIDISSNNQINQIDFTIETDPSTQTDYTIDHMIASPDNNFIYIAANPPPKSNYETACPIIYVLLIIENTYISILNNPKGGASPTYPYPLMISGVAIVEAQHPSR